MTEQGYPSFRGKIADPTAVRRSAMIPKRFSVVLLALGLSACGAGDEVGAECPGCVTGDKGGPSPEGDAGQASRADGSTDPHHDASNPEGGDATTGDGGGAGDGGAAEAGGRDAAAEADAAAHADAGASDAGVTDASDAGVTDASDAGVTDASEPEGGHDSGTSDGGMLDGGSLDGAPSDGSASDGAPPTDGGTVGGGIITGGPCVSGAQGATAFRVRWINAGGQAQVVYEVEGFPDHSRGKAAAYGNAGNSFNFHPQFVDMFLGAGGLLLDGSDFLDLELSAAGVTTIAHATVSLLGRSYSTSTSGSFDWQSFSDTGAAPTDFVSNSAPYEWYSAEVGDAIRPGDNGILLRIRAAGSSGALVVHSVEICIDAP